MNAAPAVQQQLLELQGYDSALDRLAQRRRTLPEVTEIASIDERLGALRDSVVTVQTETVQRVPADYFEMFSGARSGERRGL